MTSLDYIKYHNFYTALEDMKKELKEFPETNNRNEYIKYCDELLLLFKSIESWNSGGV